MAQAEADTATTTKQVPLIIELAYTSYTSESAEGKRKTSAKCVACGQQIKGIGTTTSNFLSHTKTHKIL